MSHIEQSHRISKRYKGGHACEIQTNTMSLMRTLENCQDALILFLLIGFFLHVTNSLDLFFQKRKKKEKKIKFFNPLHY